MSATAAQPSHCSYLMPAFDFAGVLAWGEA